MFSFTHQRHKLIPKGAEDPVPTQLVSPGLGSDTLGTSLIPRGHSPAHLLGEGPAAVNQRQEASPSSLRAADWAWGACNPRPPPCQHLAPCLRPTAIFPRVFQHSEDPHLLTPAAACKRMGWRQRALEVTRAVLLISSSFPRTGMGILGHSHLLLFLGLPLPPLYDAGCQPGLIQECFLGMAVSWAQCQVLGRRTELGEPTRRMESLCENQALKQPFPSFPTTLSCYSSLIPCGISK